MTAAPRLLTPQARAFVALRVLLIAVMSVHVGLCLHQHQVQEHRSDSFDHARADLPAGPAAGPLAGGTEAETKAAAEPNRSSDGRHADHADCLSTRGTPVSEDLPISVPVPVSSATAFLAPADGRRPPFLSPMTRPTTGHGVDLLHRVCISRT
ncbi:hypothetical protein [Actinomadura rugatobispora]|uniref:Uncharacterized protein n=1 Tax=Actinomadura rugatobispora TaxID=1994 RepID=A0ABW1AF34_9ACTN